MTARIFVATAYFDGERGHGDGPYTILVDGERIVDVVGGDRSAERGELPEAFRAAGVPVTHCSFLMPGLVEAHAHLLLDGAKLELDARSAYLKASDEEMMETGRRNLTANLAAGVTVIRDAGDRFGVNHRIRAEAAKANRLMPDIRSPGLAIRKPKKYGAFMAIEVDTPEEIVAGINQLLKTGDDLKILLTGIIDFEAGQVKGKPQFDIAEAQLIVETARKRGRPTFAHCSGADGLEIAIAAGIDSIEHGFFMTDELLEKMVHRGIAWVPTFSPVHFQWARPDIVGWNEETVGHLRRIVDSHLEHVGKAAQLGGLLVAGSDSGSHGVPHGSALVDEMFFFLEAGLTMDQTLRSATSLPRRLWGVGSADIVAGGRADFITLAGSPYDDPQALRQVKSICRRGRHDDAPKLN
ncbi:MAG: amidohydrolase family protein [Rhodobiaceae bacterium]|nr:amidohydrolase family protein [Rhodobiaceae bacterium]